MNAEVRNRIQGIATAIFKVASVVGHHGLRLGLESAAVSLASSATGESISAAENLIALGRNVGEIKSVNAVILLEELKLVRESLSEAYGASVELDISPYLDEIASLKEKGSKASGSRERAALSARLSSKNLSVVSDSAESDKEAKSRGSANSDRVFLYIREHGQARLKELEVAFPDISGRTIRRMTEGLIKESKVERVGNPGPTSFYRVRRAYAATPSEVVPVAAKEPNTGIEPSHLTPFQSVIAGSGYHIGTQESAPSPVRNMNADNEFSFRKPF